MTRVYEQGYRFFQYGIVHGGIGQCGNNKYPNIFARIEDPEIHAFIKDELSKIQMSFSLEEDLQL